MDAGTFVMWITQFELMIGIATEATCAALGLYYLSRIAYALEKNGHN
jgi:hypothetical protein